MSFMLPTGLFTRGRLVAVLGVAYLIGSFFLPAALGTTQDSKDWYQVSAATELRSQVDGPLVIGAAVIHQDSLAPLLAAAANSEKIEIRADIIVEEPSSGGGMTSTRGFGPIRGPFTHAITIIITAPGKKKPKVVTKLVGMLGDDPDNANRGILTMVKRFRLKKLLRKLGAEGGPVTFEAQVSGPDIKADARAIAIYSFRRPALEK